ncbi:MAG TPA: hypothetical protein VE961_19685 [Pyrinomonadaceae bacterium]|nr:hypothetical protein [Pyrinomonadaceae bacterium]
MSPSFEDTCDQCGAPLGLTRDSGAAEALPPPTKRTHFQPPTTTRLIGVWAIALPNIIAGLCLDLWVFNHRGGLWSFIFFWGVLGITGLWFVIFYRVTRHYFFPDHRFRTGSGSDRAN